MAYDERAVQAAPPHGIILDGRERLTVSGVSDVGSYDENAIIMTTTRGGLTVRGDGLHIEKLSLDTGDLIVHGFVTDLIYEEPAATGGFWARLLK